MTAIEAARPAMPVPTTDFSSEQVDLIKQTVAAGTSDLELALFLEVAKSSGLNPFQRQIYAVMRYDARTRGNKMVIQTGIDGYRLIAARSGSHLGTTDPEFGPVGKDGFPEFARVVVRRLVQGHVAEFQATARWSEYVQTGKEGVTAMWKRMPHTMLGKCAEALALRKAFPAELSGVYSDVEMAQADNPAPAPVQQEVKPEPSGWQEEWLKKVQGMAERVRKVAPAEAVDTIMDDVYIDAHVAEFRQAYDALKALGLKYAPAKPAPEPEPGEVRSDIPAEQPAPWDGEPMATREQEQKLVIIAKDAGATSSEDRAALWGYLLQQPDAVPTKSLTEADAKGLLNLFSALSPDERVQTLAEAKKASKGALL